MQVCVMSVLIDRYLDEWDERESHESEVREKVWELVEDDAAGELSELLCEKLEKYCESDNLDEFCYWHLEKNGYDAHVERHLPPKEVEEYLWKRAESRVHDKEEY